MNLTAPRFVPLLLLLAAGLAALLAACGGSGDADLPQSVEPTVVISRPTSPPAPTARPAVVTQAMFSQISITSQEVSALYGSTPFTQQRNNFTDITVAFTSSPELGQFLTGQNVTGSYNSWAATSGCVVCAVQVPVMVFPNDNAATMAYDRIRQVNQSIFQNVQQANGFGSYWNASFCQNGTYTSLAGQTLNWMFCAARKGNAVITVAIGGFNFDANNVGNAVRAYAMRVENYLKTQFQ
jgi:hypothetical protein